MKKRMVTLALALCVSMSLAIPVTAANTLSEPLNSSVVYAAKMSENKDRPFYVNRDIQGNVQGPSDFAVTTDGTYILNTASNAIFKVTENQKAEMIALDDFGILDIILDNFFIDFVCVFLIRSILFR
ncbi:MAG: hypothetical protein SOR61_05625 [Evtepia sp.]|uniref:hypothetical protein n=1 Tax=Evtepia sp. TaxID=2773933 RepID=UPI002A749B79|nr:hypothetical protein [Evtepia sp.]MDY3014656.1 hypothetical protein [Evtepia sp.]